MRASLPRQARAAQGLRLEHRALPEETHRTVYHPAALQAFRTVFARARP